MFMVTMSVSQYFEIKEMIKDQNQNEKKEED